MKNYAKPLSTYLFQKEWGDAFKGLPDEKAGILIKSIYSYAAGEQVKLEDPELEALYTPIIKQLNYSCGKYINKLWEKGFIEI